MCVCVRARACVRVRMYGGVCECACVYVFVCLYLFPRRYDNIHNLHGQLIVHFHTPFFSRDFTSFFLLFLQTPIPLFMFFKDEIFLCWFSRMFFFIVDKIELSVTLIVTGHFRMFPKTFVYFILHVMSSREGKKKHLFLE